jgi:hypothetical protein
LTGGGAGITVPTVDAGAPTRWLGNDGFYVLFLLLAGVLVGVGLLVSTSRAGYALRAINQDEDAAAAMGVNTTVAKTAGDPVKDLPPPEPDFQVFEFDDRYRGHNVSGERSRWNRLSRPGPCSAAASRR